MSGHCRPARAKEISRFQSCAARPSDGDHRPVRRRESSVEEALIEMYLAGVRCVGGGHHRSSVGDAGQPATVSNLNKKIYAKIEAGGTAASRVSIRTFISMAS